jgi:predicted SnoaL-like aldol condensation-catalyzing enzyme
VTRNQIESGGFNAMSDTFNLKKSAEEFLKLAASGQVEEAFSIYIDPGFVHHNQYYQGGAEALKAGMKESALKFTDKVFDIKSAMQEGDKVVTYSHLKMNPDAMEIAVFHMFKFEQGKIIEMWDVGQQISKDSPNEHGMF